MPEAARPLASDWLDQAIDVFSDAFRDYPVMRYVALGDALGEPDGDADGRMRRLTRFFVTRRFARGGPLFGVFADGTLVGTAILTLPDEPPAPPEVAVIERDAWRDLGDAARLRYDTYAQATKAFAIAAHHHHLNMIGIRASHAGRGLARPLLEAVRRLAADDPVSAGVSLTTERPANVKLYEHFGYEVLGHRHVTPDLDTWGMFLRTRSSP
jgi:GNAT superfamily N-acetyltransferase